MKKDNNLYLLDLVEYCNRILEIKNSVNEEQFSESTLIQDALLRELEVIGEISKRIDNNFKKKHSNIDWKKISGLRDIIAHDYDGIDFEIVWSILESRIPKLLEEIKSILDL